VAVESVSTLLKDSGADVVREAIDGKVVEQLEAAAEQLEAPAEAAPPDAAPVESSATIA
jgi:hypothetical protein